MFKELIYVFSIFCLNLVCCEYSLFKVATTNLNRDEPFLFIRSGGPNCSNFLQQDNWGIALKNHTPNLLFG